MHCFGPFFAAEVEVAEEGVDAGFVGDVLAVEFSR